MPAPAVYVLAIVGTVVAGIAFKEFVYEPHIAPKIERWADEFLAKRRERKRMREAPFSSSISLLSANERSSKRSDDCDDGDDKSAFELEKLVSHVSEEVREWRNEVDRSQPSTLRHRHIQSTLESPNISIPYHPMTPTHIIFDSAASPTSTLSHRAPSPGLQLHLSGSRETLRSPPPGGIPTPDTSVYGSSPAMQLTLLSPMSIPSLSLSHPVDLDHEHGVELLSAPSSRPDTPFSSFSHTDDYQSFSPSLLSVDSDAESDVISVQSSVAPSVISDFDELQSNFGSEMSGSSWASASPRSP